MKLDRGVELCTFLTTNPSLRAAYTFILGIGAVITCLAKFLIWHMFPLRFRQLPEPWAFDWWRVGLQNERVRAAEPREIRGRPHIAGCDGDVGTLLPRRLPIVRHRSRKHPFFFIGSHLSAKRDVELLVQDKEMADIGKVGEGVSLVNITTELNGLLTTNQKLSSEVCDRYTCLAVWRFIAAFDSRPDSSIRGCVQ